MQSEHEYAGADREWVSRAVRLIRADARRSADTHLVRLSLPPPHTVTLYLKDESTHPTGSLKHRLARSLFLYGLCNGQIGPQTTVVEASSGSTAISEAYFARMLGLPFVAVMASVTSPEKVTLIEREGGRAHLVADPAQVYAEAERIAAESGGLYLDQFSHAERATDWRGNNNIAESIFDQLSEEDHPIPAWVVVGAGTGGTSATIGRYARYQALPTQVCVVDPEGSAFGPHWRSLRGRSLRASSLRGSGGDTPVDGDPEPPRPSRIEGIGRARVEPSFVPEVVDRMITVPDAASIAAMQLLRERTGINAGPSTGTNLVGVLELACQLRAAGESASVVSLVCDNGERYADTYGSPAWLERNGLDPAPHAERLARAWDQARWVS